MGRAIERVALERGHEVTARIDVGNRADMDTDAFRTADVAIEFTAPAAAPGNVAEAARRGLPVVCGTTGWDAERARVERQVLEAGTALLAATNFSIGVYVFRAASRLLARFMDRFPQYSPRLHEVHHVHKLDHPSGTALTVASEMVAEVGRLDRACEVEPGAAAPEGVLPVTCERRGEVPGTHSVKWTSDVDTITLTHEALSRDGFALGAVVAAEWLAGRKGIFSIDDVLGECGCSGPEEARETSSKNRQRKSVRW